MDSFDRHVLICDPQPSAEKLEAWRGVVNRIAASIMTVNSPLGLFKISEDLGHIVEKRAAGSGELGTHVASVLTDDESEVDCTDGELYSCICAMLAVRQVIAAGGGLKRGFMAVSTWSTLSFGAPLSEPRMEALRQEILAHAQRESLQMASRVRQRTEGPRGQAGSRSAAAMRRELSETNEALRRNAELDKEDIALLRWLLADESRGLGLPFGEIVRPETAALAMGMELGRLLTVFPTVAHYRLGERFVRELRSPDLRRLIESVGDDRGPLAGLCSGKMVVEACPSVFPLMTALAGRPVEGRGARIARSLTEWWGRALLESAAAVVGSRKRWS